MVLKKLKQGMTVYDVKPTTGLQIFNGKWNVYPVLIKEIDKENNKVFASWNYNKPEWYYEAIWNKWRLKQPVDMKQSGI